MSLQREREIDRLNDMLEEGEISEDEFFQMIEEWDEGYAAAQEALWEMRNDR